MASKKKKRLILIILAVLILVCAACYTVFIQPLLEKEEVVYEEAEVFQGTFTVEVVESGSLEYTIQNVTYDIDVNAAEEEDEDEDDEEDDDEELVQKYLEIEEIYTAAGTSVAAGDPLLKFSDSSVEAVRKILQNALVNAEADYNEAESEYKLAVLEAESSYEIQRITGKYAGTIYADEKSMIDNEITSMELEIQSLTAKISSLNEAVEEAQETYDEAKAAYDTEYYSYMNYYNNLDNIVNTITGQNFYLNAKNTLDRAESNLEKAKSNLEQNAEQIKQLEQNIALAKAQSLINKLEVEQSYSESKINSDNAEYSLNATLESLIEDLEEAEEEKKTLEEKLANFEKLVGEEGIVYAIEDGLITSVYYSAGDTLEQVGNLFSYASEDTMHISVDVTQEDIITLAVGDEVGIQFRAYEEQFTGYIESINTTATSAETPTVSYQVVIQVVGTLDQLFDGMSANVSFVTEEKAEAVYVQRKAIVEENGKEYVYVKDGLVGKTLTVVETGLRNENYVEILSGITVEDTIYVPSAENGAKTAIKGGSDGNQDTYRETTVEYGSLVVGIEESGSVDIGTVEQTFTLDMSALQRVQTSNAGSSQSGGGMSAGGGMAGSGFSMSGGGSLMGGGMNSFTQIFDMAGGSSVAASGEASELEIAEVCVSVGQQVEEGDVLYLLVEDGVSELANDLESNVIKAKADLDALVADQQLSKATAENTYNISIAYGDFAALEKNSTILKLQQNVEDKQEALETAQANITSIQTKLEQANYDLDLAKQLLDNSIWGRDHADKDDVLTYTYQFEIAKQAQSSYDTLEQQKEQIESSLEQAEKNLETCKKQLAEAQRNLASGTLSAEQTYELRMLAYENAQETYDITVAYLEDDLAAQEEIYAEAKEKWDEFASHIDGNQVRAKYSGVITSVDLAVGDSLTTGTTIATLYDVNEVSMTVTLEEEDMTHIEEGGMANISFTAYPDDIFKAVVSEISDASSDSSGNTTYDVTVTLQGDVSKLFQGMTGDITFITKEMEEVMYVSNRAIIREGTKSYVKVKDAKGNIKKTEVVTGFSDGVNVEIVEGLAIGDVVLIESKVTNE